MALRSLRSRNAPVVSEQHQIDKDQENLVGKPIGKHPQLTRVSGTVAQRSALGDIQNRLAPQQLVKPKKSLEGEKKPLAKPTLKPSFANVQAKVDTRRPLRSSRSSNSTLLITQPSKPPVAAPSTSSTHEEPVVLLKNDLNKTASEAMEVSHCESPCREAGYSSDLLKNVNDIDANDEDLPLLVSEYVNDIYVYLRKLEKEQFVKDNYLDKQAITGRMRQILIDWLMQVHLRFGLLPETMYMTVAIIDRYLQEKPCTKDQLQLVGVTAMLLASKYEEIYAPEINDFVYITDRCYTAKQVRVMEIDILKVLNFNLGRPLPIHFLRRYSKAADADAKKHMMAKYVMELCLVDYSMVSVNPSKMAASSLYLVHLLTGEAPWSNTLTFYSKYTPDDLLATVSMVAKVTVKAHSSTCKTVAIRNKYSASKYMAVSEMECFKGDVLKQLATA